MTAYTGTSAGATRSRRTGAAGPGLLLLSVIGAIGVFWLGLVSLGQAWATPEYSHGPVIPLLSAYMFLIEMRRVPQTRAVPHRAPGVWIVFVALLLGVLGTFVTVPEVVTYALILWIWGIVLTVFGLRRGWVLWPAVLHLVFMLPLPQVIYWKLSTSLQLISSEIGVGVIALFGIPVYLDGNVIDLGIYNLQVAEACSGLRYLFPVMSFSYVFCVLYNGPRWHKFVLFLAAAPITVLMNSFRIGVIGILVDNFGIGQAEGFMHAFEGWIIFIACILILFGIAVILQRTRRHPQRITDTLELDFGSALPQLRRFLGLRAEQTMAVAAIATLTAALAVHAMPERKIIVPERTPLALFPSEIGPWQAGMPQRLEAQIEQVLAADDYLQVNFMNPGEAAPVDLFVAYYHRQTAEKWIHSPQICIPGEGWEVSAWRRYVLMVRRAAAGGSDVVSVPVNRTIIQKGLSRQLVLYWFEQRGRRMSNDYAVKVVNLWDELTVGRTNGALVRLVTPLAPGESADEAEERLVRFLGHGIDVLPRFIPS